MNPTPSSAEGFAPSRICGLLYCGPRDERHVNLADAGGDPLAVYVRNALTLARSLRVHGQALTLITNDAARLEPLIAAANGADAGITLAEVPFTLDVPRGIPFESCHYRLEVHRMLGEGLMGDFPAMIDLDVVALAPLAFPRREGMWLYDVSRQYWGDTPPARLTAQMDAIAGETLPARRWFGGEFFAGEARHFAALWDEIAAIWPRYRAQWQQIERLGDEIIHSAAFTRLEARGLPIHDAGAAGLVARWWSVPTEQPMAPLSSAAAAALLHLPADKALLSDWAERPFAAEPFLADLRAATRRNNANPLRRIGQFLKGRTHGPVLP